MKSLQALAIAKTAELQNLTLGEIANQCQDDAGFCNALFSSREAVLSFFDGYMKGSADVPDLSRSRMSDRLKSMLKRRDDVNTSSELKAWFTALARGFVWEYIVDPNIDWIAVPRFSDLRKDAVVDIKLYGTLPCENCIGFQFETHAFYELGKNERMVHGLTHSDFIIRSDREIDARFDRKYKMSMYAELCKDIDAKLRLLNFSFRKQKFTGRRLVVIIDGQIDVRLNLVNEDIWSPVVNALVDSNIDFLNQDDQQDPVLEVKIYQRNSDVDRDEDLIFRTETTVVSFRF